MAKIRFAVESVSETAIWIRYLPEGNVAAFAEGADQFVSLMLDFRSDGALRSGGKIIGLRLYRRQLRRCKRGLKRDDFL